MSPWSSISTTTVVNACLLQGFSATSRRPRNLHILLPGMSFRTSSVLFDGNKPFLRGIMFQSALLVSTLGQSVLRNVLFCNAENEFGFEVIALDSPHCRDHALPS